MKESILQPYLTPEALTGVLNSIQQFKSQSHSHVKVFWTDTVAVLISHLNWETMCNKLLSKELGKQYKECHYVILPDVEQDLLVVLMSVESLDHKQFCINEFRSHFLDAEQHIVCPIWVDESQAEPYRIHVQCANVSHYTLLPNLLEIISNNEIFAESIHIAQAIETGSKEVQSCFDIDIKLKKPLAAELLHSLADDFRRYLQIRMKALSIFDLVGPAMVGPSSSHTAGASRIGLLSRHIIEAVIASGEKVDSLKVVLYASFRDTGVAHKTPHALGGGLSGFATDDAELLAHGDPEYLNEHGFEMGGQHIIFEGYKKGSQEEEKRFEQQIGHNIAEIIFHTDRATHSIVGFSVGGGNIEIRAYDGWLRSPINGKSDMKLVDGRLEACSKANEHYPTVGKIFNDEAFATPAKLPFNSFEEMLRYAHEKNKDIIDLIVETEMTLQDTNREKIYAKMAGYWHVMQHAVEQGLKSKTLSLFKLSGKNASKLNAIVHDNMLFDNLFGRSIAYAVAVNEINAKSGLIVACPTAGSCGILPGVMKAYEEARKPSEQRICEAMMVAGFFGMLLFDDVSTAGADYGCQAEVGAASAMAAAALTYLEGGDTDQMVEAFTIAIKNVLGLICDPVAGLVEVPCVKRNGMYATQAISAAMMALSGVKSFISPDEVMLTMKEVGQRLNIDYKETGRAGLAKTRDGKQVENAFAGEIRKFFG